MRGKGKVHDLASAGGGRKREITGWSMTGRIYPMSRKKGVVPTREKKVGTEGKRWKKNPGFQCPF